MGAINGVIERYTLESQIPVEAAVNQNEVEAYKERLNKRQRFEQDASNANTGKTSGRRVSTGVLQPMDRLDIVLCGTTVLLTIVLY